MDYELEQVAKLLPGGLFEVSAEQGDGIRDRMPRRIWFVRSDDGKRAHLWCDSCGQWRTVDRRKDFPQHGEKYTCPCCRNEMTARSLRKSHRYLYDDLLVTLYDKGSDGETIIARTFYAVRDYGGEAWVCEEDDDIFNPSHVQTDLQLYGVCEMSWDRRVARRWEREHFTCHETVYGSNSTFGGFYKTQQCSGPQGRFVHRKKFGSPMQKAMGRMRNVYAGGLGGHAMDCTILEEELDAVLEGTRAGEVFRLLEDGLRAGVDRYDGYNVREAVSLDFVQEIGGICKRPQIEYLAKLGLTDIAVRALTDTVGSEWRFNWRGKTAAAVLGIPQGDIRAARSAGVEITVGYLATRQLLETNGIHARPEEIKSVERDTLSPGSMAILDRFHGARRQKALRYYIRQRTRNRTSWSEVRDYWYEVERMGGDLIDDAAAFPTDLHAMHERNRERIRIMENKADSERIEAQVKRLAKRFGFEANGILLRPAETAIEVIREGEALHHCVGSYVQRYASGKTAIFVMRRTDAPEVPWRTVEIDPVTGTVRQDRGDHNDFDQATHKYGPTGELKEELDEFWAAWNKRGDRREWKTA